MNDPIRKELLTESPETVRRPESTGMNLEEGQKTTVFIGENSPAATEYIVTPETHGSNKEGETRWDYIEGRFYRYEDCTDPEVAKAQGEDVPPGLYVKVKPVDAEDFANPSSREDIRHAIQRVLYTWAGMSYVNPDYELAPARYLENARLFLVRVEPKGK